MSSKTYTGINIQYPISQLIVKKHKVIETRTYPIPDHYINQEMALVETPGKTGNFKARIIAIITFGASHKYKSEKEFYADKDRHCVTPESPWAWSNTKGKWGWPIVKLKCLKKPVPLRKRIGIKYTKNIEI